MARRRFLVPQIRDNAAELTGPDARHLARVLRARPGQQYEISDGAQTFLAEIASVEKDRVLFQVLSEIQAPVATVQLQVFAALIKFDRFEWIVEKATELGASVIVPVIAERTERGLEEAARKRIERWRRIAHESAQQSRRQGPPHIPEAATLQAALKQPLSHRYFFDEKPGAPSLLTSLPPQDSRRPADTVALLTGPEGGWTDSERQLTVGAGWQPVSLGPLILRAETAAIAGAALLAHAWWAAQLK